MRRIDPIPAAPRAELMALFDRLAARRIVYIHAPAGYGKSFSVRMWLERSGLPSAWVAMTETAGHKPAEFCERFAAALLTLRPHNSALRTVLAQKAFASAPFEFASRALKAFRFHRRLGDKVANPNCVLVIDDLHLVTNPDILKRLPELIADLPEYVTLFLLSRAAPPTSFSELVIKDALALVDVASLKFSETEIKSLFAAHGKRLTAAQTADILAATDGWAIGLNAMLLSGGHPTGQKLLSRYLETFIREQVWENWDEARRSFLLRASVADELTLEFCLALTGQPNSADMLDALAQENAFTSVDADGVYRFHHLFRDFLQSQLALTDKTLERTLYQRAGDWFFAREDNYKAVEYYMKSGDKRGITKGLKRMYDYNSPYASIEDTLSIIHLSVDGSIVDEYPFLLEVQAWAAFAEGDAETLIATIDQYYHQFPKILLQNPKSAQTYFLIRLMDPRITLINYTQSIKNIPMKKSLTQKAFMPSVSHNMPLFHRSNRDFSEFALNPDQTLPVLRKTIGVFFNSEFDVIEDCLRAGFAYERGNQTAAHNLALSANAKVKDSFAPELKFCALMILATVLDAQGNRIDAAKVLDGASSMIETDRAYYLSANFQAYHHRLRLFEGDIEAAIDWLRNYADLTYTSLPFYKLYQHFTTARAYIVTADYSAAILFLKKLLTLCDNYRRPLDIMEANILLAIAYWKKGRGLRDEAFEPLERAILLSLTYGFTQIFANEGAELINMLHQLQKRVSQKDYPGPLTSTTLKTLYISALARSKISRGLTGGRIPENLKFTDQQLTVMHHLSSGLTHKQIAAQMNLKPSAIKSHLILIYKKLDVTNNIDAILKLRELGVLQGASAPWNPAKGP